MKNGNLLLFLLLIFVQEGLLSQNKNAFTVENSKEGASSTVKQVITFGICTDVHQDIIHNGEERLNAFVDDMTAKKADFIIQLGDFCYPESKNDEFMSIFQQFGKNAYSVIGNHDRDNGVSKKDMLTFFNIPAAYYSFDKKEFHFIVLDGNEKGVADDDYPLGISDAQLECLSNDLNDTDKKTIIFIHQSLVYDIGNGEEIRNIFSTQRLSDSSKKVLACFNGHKHTDQIENFDGVWYVTINSISNMWAGEEFEHKIDGIPESVYVEKPELKYVFPYSNALYAYVTLFSDGTLSIKGQLSTWKTPTPEDIGYHLSEGKTPKISDRVLK